MTLTSNTFDYGQAIPIQYTLYGQNLFAPLLIQDVIPGTQSLVLVIDDSDAPGGTFTHLLLWNIDPSTTEISPDSDKESGLEMVIGMNDFGRMSYDGPKPPNGTHRYFFHLFALNKILDLPSSCNRQSLEEAMADSILGKAELMGLFSTPQS